jgi:hypothetical protein
LRWNSLFVKIYEDISQQALVVSENVGTERQVHGLYRRAEAVDPELPVFIPDLDPTLGKLRIRNIGIYYLVFSNKGFLQKLDFLMFEAALLPRNCQPLVKCT